MTFVTINELVIFNFTSVNSISQSYSSNILCQKIDILIFIGLQSDDYIM